MIKQEIIGDLVRTWSDRGMMIRGGFPEGLYEEAVDPVSAGRVYEETDIPIEETSIEEKAEAFDILMGKNDGH